MEDIELLIRAKRGRDIVVRDDQFDFNALLDAAKACRDNGRRLSLVDSGKLTAYDLEWLGEAGADFYSSDGTPRDERELTLINKACRKGDGIVAYLHRGAPEGLKDLGRSGIYLHLSDKEQRRNLSELADLAFNARKGGGWLVYYHHGILDADLETLARNGAWIHLADSCLREEKDIPLFIDIVRASIHGGANCVLHVAKGVAADWLRDIFDAGALILFKIPPADYKSPLKVLERKAKKRQLDFRTYYLYPKFFI